MPNNSLGIGFAQGVQQGMHYGFAAYQDKLAREQRAKELAATVLQRQQDRQDMLDQQAMQARHYAAANPEAALAEVAAFRQQGPLTQPLAIQEQIATPLAFQAMQERQQQEQAKAALDAQIRQQRAAQIAQDAARTALLRDQLAGQRTERMAGAAGQFAGQLLDSSAVAQLAKQALTTLPKGTTRAPQMDTVEETKTLEDGTQVKTTRRVPAGAATAKPADSAALPGKAGTWDTALASLTTTTKAEEEAKLKKIQAEKAAIDKANAEGQRARMVRDYPRGFPMGY